MYKPEHHQRWYAKHKDRHYEYYRKKQERNKALLKKLKDKPCMDCGVKYPHYVMDFDHRDPETKTKNISRMLTTSVKTIMDEVAKCDLVCANCHRERTYGIQTVPPC